MKRSTRPSCHPRESGDPEPRRGPPRPIARLRRSPPWAPAFAGDDNVGGYGKLCKRAVRRGGRRGRALRRTAAPRFDLGPAPHPRRPAELRLPPQRSRLAHPTLALRPRAAGLSDEEEHSTQCRFSKSFAAKPDPGDSSVRRQLGGSRDVWRSEGITIHFGKSFRSFRY